MRIWARISCVRLVSSLCNFYTRLIIPTKSPHISHGGGSGDRISLCLARSVLAKRPPRDEPTRAARGVGDLIGSDNMARMSRECSLRELRACEEPRQPHMGIAKKKHREDQDTVLRSHSRF